MLWTADWFTCEFNLPQRLINRIFTHWFIEITDAGQRV